MILVTGAAGHLGNVLVRELLTKGVGPVRAMVHRRADPPSLQGLPVDIVRADITRPETLVAAFQGVDRVVHLASLVSIGDASAEQVRRINVEGTVNVLEACRTAGVFRLLYAGSVHAFAPPAGAGVIDESTPLATTGSPYEVTKAEATRRVLAATDLDVVVACPGGVIGPFDFLRSEVGGQIRQWARTGVAVTVPGGYDFADVRDIGSGLAKALDLGRRGEVYLLSNAHIEVTDLARQVIRAAGKRGPVLRMPLPAAYAAARLSLATARFRRGKPTFTPYALDTLQARYAVDSGKARRELGYRTRPLEETIIDTTQWWLEHPNAGGGKRSATPKDIG